jgi:hypothetical protein
MNNKLAWWMSLVAAVILAPAAVAVTPSWSYEAAKITKGEFAIHTACMMPATGKLTRIGMKGQEGMAKESQEWSDALENLVEAHLKTANVEMIPALSAGTSSASADEIQQVVLQIAEKYNGVSAQIDRKPKDIGKARFTLGDEVALLPCAAKADVLVFVTAEGQVTTGGKKAMSLLVGGAVPYASLILTMADAKTGEIVAFARMSNAESFGEKFVGRADEVFGKALDKQFGKLRLGSYQKAKK